MLWRRHIAQEEVAGKVEKGQGADAGIWDVSIPQEAFIAALRMGDE